MEWSLIEPFWYSTWACVLRILSCLFLKVGGDVITWDLFWGALDAICQINFVSRRSCLECSVGSIEPLHKDVDDVFQFEHNFDDANLRGLSSCGIWWIRILRFERNFIPKREIEKKMFSQVVKCALDSCLSCVFVTEAMYNLSWFHVGTVVLFQFRKLNEVFDLSIQMISPLAFVMFICKLPTWKVEMFSWWISHFGIDSFGGELVMRRCDKNPLFSIEFRLKKKFVYSEFYCAFLVKGGAPYKIWSGWLRDGTRVPCVMCRLSSLVPKGMLTHGTLVWLWKLAFH